MKGVKGNKTVVVSKAKKRMHVFDSSSEEDKVSKPKKVFKKKKQVKDVKKRKHVFYSSSSYDDSSLLEEEKVLKLKKVIKKNKQVKDVKKQVKDESSSSEDKKPFKNKKRSQHVKDVKKKKKKPLTTEQIKKIEYLSDLPCLRLTRSSLVPSCFAIFDLKPLTLSLDFVLMYEIFKSLSFRLDHLCHLAILCLDQHAHTLHHLESLLTISLDRLDILKEDLFDHEHVIQRISLTGFPAQIVRPSNAVALDSPYLLVLNTRTSQSRQYDMSESDSYYLSD
ncbi:hypothetical protein Tco_0273750 [Tanacetum coccineum]